MSAGVDDVDLGLSPDEVAAAEFVIRCRIGSPLKSSFKPKELVEPCRTSASKIGRSLSAMRRHAAADLAIETRPGGRGGTRYIVTRAPDDREPRQWWVEGGERRGP